MRFILLIHFISILSSAALADKMPLLTDSTVTTSAEILNRIQSDGMALIKAKYSDLQKNFTPNFLTSGLDLDCHSGPSSVGSTSQYAGFRISNSSKILPSGLVQSSTGISHYDCFGHLIFVERISAIGPMNLPMLSVSDATKFVRYFEVQTGEMARNYEIENSQAQTLFSVHSQRLTDRVYSVVEIFGNKLLELDQIDPTINERRLYIQLHSRSGPTKVLKTLWTDRSIKHEKDGVTTNQVDFDSYLSGTVESQTSEVLKQILDGSIQRFPETKKVQVGVSDSPFLRELQLNYRRMLTNTEPEQVKLFFQKAIDDIKTGRIKVE